MRNEYAEYIDKENRGKPEFEKWIAKLYLELRKREENFKEIQLRIERIRGELIL